MQKEKNHELNIVLFSRDYYPGYGGVKNYTHNFFKFLEKNAVNVRLIAPQNIQKDKNIYVSNISHERKLNENIFDRFYLTRKLYTFKHIYTLRKQSKRDIEENSLKRKHLIVTSFYDLQTLIFLDECLKKKIKFSIVFHGLDIIHQTGKQTQRWVDLFYKVVKACSSIIFNSESTKALFNEKIGIKKKNIIIYPGLDIQSINDELYNNIDNDSQKVLDNDMEDITVLSIGSLVKRKGFDIAIKAMKKIFQENAEKKIKYLIAGDGNFKETLSNLILEESLQHKVHLLGNISDPLKFRLLQKSDIFVMPSYSLSGTNIEGFGIVYLEAAYMNNYIIGTNSGGIPEAVPKAPQGALVDIHGPEDYENLSLVISEKIDLIHKGIKVKVDEEWIKQFEWDILIKKFLKFFNQNSNFTGDENETA